LQNALAALAGGMVSAGCVLAMDANTPQGLMLLSLAPLPLFASGLSAGALTCLAAGLTAAVIVTLVMGSTAGACYLAAACLPVAILVRQALRSAGAEHGGAFGGGKVWYGGGRLLMWLAGLGMVGVLGVVGYFTFLRGGLVTAVGERLGLAPLAAAMAARIAPGLLVALWMAVIAVGGVIAEWLAVIFGWAIRPPIDIGRINLPLWIGPVLMVAGLAGAIVRQGMAGIICLNAAIVLIVPFAFLGLAIIHAQAGKRPGGRVMLGAAYAVLLGSPAVFGWRALLIFVLMLAGLGSVDQLLDLRDMRGLRSGMRRK
jgi:hypothetical protein